MAFADPLALTDGTGAVSFAKTLVIPNGQTYLNVASTLADARSLVIKANESATKTGARQFRQAKFTRVIQAPSGLFIPINLGLTIDWIEDAVITKAVFDNEHALIKNFLSTTTYTGKMWNGEY